MALVTKLALTEPPFCFTLAISINGSKSAGRPRTDHGLLTWMIIFSVDFSYTSKLIGALMKLGQTPRTQRLLSSHLSISSTLSKSVLSVPPPSSSVTWMRQSLLLIPLFLTGGELMRIRIQYSAPWPSTYSLYQLCQLSANGYSQRLIDRSTQQELGHTVILQRHLSAYERGYWPIWWSLRHLLDKRSTSEALSKSASKSASKLASK